MKHKSLLALSLQVVLNASPALAGTYTVSTVADNYSTPVAGSLRDAINQANADPSVATIVFNIPGGGTINLAANAGGDRMLPIFTNPNGISIDGSNGGQGAITIDGGSTSASTGDRLFFIGVQANTPGAAGGNQPSTAATSFSVANLTLQNGNARGGAGGGSGTSNGGGGAGLGGAIFLNAGNLTLSGVTFSNNIAVGGAGSVTGSTTRSGGGGGMGGNGAAAAANMNGGGGGLGLAASGGGNGQAGRGGNFIGAAAGGFGGFGSSAGGAGGASGGGGGGGVSGAGGSAGGGGGVAGGNGGNGGGNGGVGGFGGGGGGGGDGGAGGFGGGGGGGASGGAGGFGGGARNGAQGGGGLAAGGAIFVRQGGTVTITDGGISGNNVIAGTGGAASAIGQALFLAGSATYHVSTNNTVTITNTLGGGDNALITGGFTKTGSGTLVLSGSNSYTGGTIVSDGTFVANNSSGSATGTGTVTVNSGGTLGGTGTISGAIAVNSGATLAPGASPGTLNSGAVSFSSGSTFSVEITGATVGSQYDQLNVTGTVELNNATLSLSGAYVPASGDSFVIINNDGSDAITSTFNGLPEGSIVTINGVNRKLTYIGGTGNDVVLLSSPEIGVQQPVGTDLVNGTSSIDFGTVSVSSSVVKTFTITNSGTANLTNLVITNNGTNSGDFIVGALGSTTVNPGSNTTFTVTFTPTGVVNRSAAISITSNMTGANNPFTVNLSGQGYYTQAQFDANRAAGISDVTSNPNAYDLYTTSQIQALNVGTPLIQRNSTTGLFTLTIAVQKSTNLVDFIHLPMTAPQTTINAEGKLEFRFGSPDNAAFFRLESK